MKLQIVKGSTSQIIIVFIQDSSSTTGAGLAGLDQASSIVGGYVRPGGLGLALAVDQNVTTEGTYEAPTTDNQIRIGTPANMTAGTYELHLHNDLLAAGADSVLITLGGASNMADLVIEIQLTDFDLNNATPPVNAAQISGDTTAADNLESQYDGTGLLGGTFPLRQDQGASISGGLAVATAMASVTAIQGSQQNLANASTSNDVWWTGDDDGSGAEFIFRCTPVDAASQVGDVHFEGYYSEPTGATNGATVEVYNFATTVWDSIISLTNSGSDELHDEQLTHQHQSPVDGTVETVAHTKGDVLIKFSQDSQETGNEVLFIDLMTVGFISSPVTAAEIVDEWETQSQADPTGFHVNVKEVNGTNQTAIDINDIKAVTDALPDAGALTTIGTDTARLTAARAQVLTDWQEAGRLDVLLDAIPTTAEFEARTVGATAATNMDTLYDGVEGFASAYAGPRGPGVYYDDAAANTNTVDGTDGTWSNHVSTPAAVKTLTDSLGLKRVYIVNNSSFTPPAAMEDYEFIAIGEMTANTFVYGSEDVDRTVFYNLLLTGTQGGTGRCQAIDCCLSVIAGMEITALGCLLADAGSLTLRNDCAFDRWWSAVAGGGTPKLNINSVANVNAYMRHGSGGIQIDNAVATTVMSVETDGQVVVDATCTSLEIYVRGNCSITDSGTTTNLAEDAAVNIPKITGGSYSLDTDANGRIRIVDGTGAGEINTNAGAIEVVNTILDYTGNTAQTVDMGGIVAGMTSLPEWLGLLAGKQVGNSTARAEIRATGAGSGTYDETADSPEAIRDRGDAAWSTATGFNTVVPPSVAQFNARTLVAASYFDPAADTVANVTTVGSVTTKTGYALVSTGLDLVLVDGRDLPNALEIIAAGVIGKISGAGTGTEVFVGLDGVTTRATVTVDGSGNRTGVVYV